MNEAGLPDTLPGFDDPLALLRACHNKILAHCDMLEVLLGKQGIDDEARQLAKNITRYFSTSAKLHHQDEEEDLFPRLIRQSLWIADLIHDLKKEHTTLDALWKTIEAELKQLPANSFSNGFVATANEFCTLCRQHVTRENKELLPLAANSLDHLELGYVGEAMAKRRGVRIT